MWQLSLLTLIFWRSEVLTFNLQEIDSHCPGSAAKNLSMPDLDALGVMPPLVLSRMICLRLKGKLGNPSKKREVTVQTMGAIEVVRAVESVAETPEQEMNQDPWVWRPELQGGHCHARDMVS